MRIGDEYSSEKVMAKNFEQLAEEAGLGKPLVRGRVVELPERVIATLPKLEIPHPVARKVAALIRQRSEKVVSRFGTQPATLGPERARPCLIRRLLKRDSAAAFPLWQNCIRIAPVPATRLPLERKQIPRAFKFPAPTMKQ